jgi:voltage-dependent calcium channel alpha-2/delta-3
MRNIKLEIGIEVVKKIVATLGDNDYFNILQFADVVNYLDPCLNGTLVQATVGNKQTLLNSLSTIPQGSISNHETALGEAFKLFNIVNETGHGSQCNKAIMLITDTVVSGNFDNLLMNWPSKDVRLFVYLTGKETVATGHLNH